MQNEIRRIFNSQKGAGLIIAVYLSAIVVIVIAGFESWNAYNFKNTISAKKKNTYCQYAESGIEKAIYKLMHTEDGKEDYDSVFKQNLDRLIVIRDIVYVNPFNNNVDVIGEVNFDEGKIKVRMERFP
ncbi:MAG: hypothetical protein ABID79_03890 [Elusimicrobiota bacterium]